MRKAKKAFLLLSFLLLCTLMTTTASAAVKISKRSATLIAGQSVQLKITGTKATTWNSSNKTIATVSTSGKVTAIKKGTATITAKVENKKYNCKVTVQTPTISKSSLSLFLGKTATIKMKGTNQKVAWKTSNKNIATVTSKGKITAKKAGTVSITATVLGKKYTCKVTVKAPKISSTSISITVGNTHTLKMTGASGKITWSSSNKKIATVSSTGVVKGIKAGTATITAKVGGKKYTCKVTVKEKEKVLFPNKADCGKGVFYIYTNTETSENGNIPVIYLYNDRFSSGISFCAYGVDNSVPIHLYFDKETYGGSYYVGYIIQRSIGWGRWGNDPCMQPGLHTVEMVQYKNNNPKDTVITYRKAKYRVIR